MERTRVLIVDDHEVFATSLARTLAAEPDLEIVGTARTETEALAEARKGVDVIVCDFRLAGADGITLSRTLRDTVPDARIVMLTASTDEAVLVAALDAGCAGFITKSQPLDDLLDAIRAAAAGEAMVNPALLARLLPRITRRGGPNPDLSARERHVLAVMAEGATNQAIAERLVLSRDTVRNHVSNILRKLGAHSKLEAVAIAAQRGLIRFDGSRSCVALDGGRAAERGRPGE